MTATLISLTLRGLLNRRRTLLLALLSVLIVVITGINHLSQPTQGEAAEFTGRVLADFGLAVLLPLVAVIVATAALGSELEEGTIIYLLARPIGRGRILLAKLGVSWLVVAALVAVPIVAAGVVGQAGSPRLGIAYGIGATLGALEYTAIFVALSLMTSRALVIGLAYVVIWEGVVSGLFAGTRILSVRQHALSVAEPIGGEGAVAAELEPAVAIVTALLVTVVATILAIHRLERVELRGETT